MSNASRVLVHAHNGRVDHLHGRVMSRSERVHDPAPDASLSPANEAIVNNEQSMGRSRGGLTSKIHVVVDRGALTEAARVSVTGCCRSLRQVVGGRFEATWNDSEIFSLDKTIEARRPESF